jgi:hypothetical protein
MGLSGGRSAPLFEGLLSEISLPSDVRLLSGGGDAGKITSAMAGALFLSRTSDESQKEHPPPGPSPAWRPPFDGAI